MELDQEIIKNNKELIIAFGKIKDHIAMNGLTSMPKEVKEKICEIAKILDMNNNCDLCKNWILQEDEIDEYGEEVYKCKNPCGPDNNFISKT